MASVCEVEGCMPLDGSCGVLDGRRHRISFLHCSVCLETDGVELAGDGGMHAADGAADGTDVW